MVLKNDMSFCLLDMIWEARYPAGMHFRKMTRIILLKSSWNKALSPEKESEPSLKWKYVLLGAELMNELLPLDVKISGCD